MQQYLRSEVAEARSCSSSALDLEIFSALRELLPDSEIDSIYGAFVRHTRERIAGFRGSCDAATVELEAHSLRGSAAMLGASALAAFAADLERHGAAGELLRERADALEEALSKLSAALRDTGVRL